MKKIFWKPNLITIGRILLIPVFIWFLLSDITYKDYIAAFIFIALSLSDALDGYLARKHRQITGLGKILDPIADKLLISAALIFLVGRIQLWMAIVIIARELIITAARLFFLPKKVIAASILGKIKTIFQIIAILAVILNIPFNWWIMLAAVIITVVSGLDYLVKMGRISGENLLSLPNIITSFRLVLIPFFIVSIFKSNINLALITFVIIILSDKLDGVSARITKQITKAGRIYDAFADFIFIVSSYFVFFAIGNLQLVWVVLFLVPSIVLFITKTFHLLKVNEISSRPLGKIVVGVSYVAIAAVTINFIYKDLVLLLIAILANAYMFSDVYESLKIRKLR